MTITLAFGSGTGHFYAYALTSSRRHVRGTSHCFVCACDLWLAHFWELHLCVILFTPYLGRHEIMTSYAEGLWGNYFGMEGTILDSLLSDPFIIVTLKCIILLLFELFVWMFVQWTSKMCLSHISKYIYILGYRYTLKEILIWNQHTMKLQ